MGLSRKVLNGILVDSDPSFDGPLIDVSAIGAVGLGTSDDAPFIDEATDLLSSTGAGGLWFPASKYRCDTPLTVSSRTAWKGVTRGDTNTAGESTMIYASGANDLFDAAAGSVKFVQMCDLRLVQSSATGGHVIDLGTSTCSFWTMKRVVLSVANPAKSAINMDDGQWVDSLVEDFSIFGKQTHTVPLVYLRGSGGTLNSFTFRRGRVTDTGNYAFWVEELSNDYANDAKFSEITFEKTNGGNIKLLSAKNCVIEDCNSYDLQTVGDTTRDLYVVDNSTLGGTSIGNTFSRVCRRQGTLGAGLRDIKLAGGAKRTKIVGANGAIDLGNNAAILDGLLYSDSPAAEVFNRDTTKVTEVSAQFVAHRTKAGVPSDADFTGTPPNGAVVIDTTNSKIYVRIGGAWVATAALT